MELFASHCVFPTPDIRRTAEYYVEKLGFRRVDYLDAREKHICLYRDGVEFILTQSDGREVVPNRVLYGYGGDAYVIVRDQQALQDEYEAKGVKIVQRLHKTDYHNREFVIEDIDGRWIYFGIKE
jgi:catechol 2,3-dioxygenase-like lactoylglutathione lyase family enzyme